MVRPKAHSKSAPLPRQLSPYFAHGWHANISNTLLNMLTHLVCKIRQEIEIYCFTQKFTVLLLPVLTKHYVLTLSQTNNTVWYN